MKKSLLILFAVAIVGISACSNTDDSNRSLQGEQQNPQIETGEAGSAESTSSETSFDPLGKFEPAIEVSVIGTTSTGVIYVDGESVDDNIMTQTYRDILGINFVNKWVVDASQAAEKLNLAIASNDIPDISYVNVSQLQRMIKSGQLEDLTDVYEKYASPALKKAMEYGDGSGFIPASVGGKIYGMPVPLDYYEQVAIMYIRQDWLDRLKLGVPKTMDELTNVATAFATQDPDGNGKADTYGIALDNALGMGFAGISAAFNAYNWIWLRDETGNVVYGSIQPEMKEALAKLSELYASGALDPEFGTKDWSKTADDIGAGKGGIYFGAFWQPLYPLMLTKTHTPDSEWVAHSIPVGAEGVVVPMRPSNVSSWIVARKGMEHPEAMIKAMNLWVELNFDKGRYNDVFYTQIQGNEKYAGVYVHQYAKPYFFDDPGKNMEIGKQFRDALEHDDASLVTHPDGVWKWEEFKNNGPNGWGYGKYLLEAELVLENYQENYRTNEFLGAPTATMEQRSGTLIKLESETFTKIIMGQSPIGEFDHFVEQWKRLGGDQITNEVNEWTRGR